MVMGMRETIHANTCPFGTQRPRRTRWSLMTAQCSQIGCEEGSHPLARRTTLQQMVVGIASILASSKAAPAAPPRQPETPAKLLCGPDCQDSLKGIEEVKTSSGLRYKDIKVGKGPIPPTGYQVVANYVAMTPDGRVVDSSLDKGRPYDLRIGAGQIVAGLDEGVASMRAGGVRRIYVPGNLSFPKGLASGPGRPRVPPASPVMFDVELLFIPGLDTEDEE